MQNILKQVVSLVIIYISPLNIFENMLLTDIIQNCQNGFGSYRHDLVSRVLLV